MGDKVVHLRFLNLDYAEEDEKDEFKVFFFIFFIIFSVIQVQKREWTMLPPSVGYALHQSTGTKRTDWNSQQIYLLFDTVDSLILKLDRQIDLVMGKWKENGVKPYVQLKLLDRLGF